jgi:hypothetical protein
MTDMSKNKQKQDRQTEDKIQKDQRTATQIIVAIIGAVALIISGLLGYFGSRYSTERPIEATLTAEARPTQINLLPLPSTNFNSFQYKSITMFPTGQELLLAAAENKLFAYNGFEWYQVLAVPEKRTTSILPNHCDIFVGTEDDRGMVYQYLAKRGEWISYDTTQLQVNVLIKYQDAIYAGTSPYGIILRFSSSRWSTVFDSNDAYVTTMAIYNHKLYAGSEWRGVVYEYDGASWRVLIDTEEDSGGAFPLIVYQQKLFSTLGNPRVLYAYDGSQWSKVYEFPDGEAIWRGAIVFQGKLYIGSFFSGNIYEYDGNTMRIITTLPASKITAMAEYLGKLFVSAWENGIWTFDGNKWSKEPNAPIKVYTFSKYTTCIGK